MQSGGEATVAMNFHLNVYVTKGNCVHGRVRCRDWKSVLHIGGYSAEF